jgi:hypothetical protein
VWEDNLDHLNIVCGNSSGNVKRNKKVAVHWVSYSCWNQENSETEQEAALPLRQLTQLLDKYA